MKFNFEEEDLPPILVGRTTIEEDKVTLQILNEYEPDNKGRPLSGAPREIVFGNKIYGRHRTLLKSFEEMGDFKSIEKFVQVFCGINASFLMAMDGSDYDATMSLGKYIAEHCLVSARVEAP